MINRSRLTNLLTPFAIALWAFVGFANGAELDPPPDIHGLEEVRHISKLPPDLAKTLGWQSNDKDTIGDLEREPGASNPKLLNRWFVLGGLSKTYSFDAGKDSPAYSFIRRFHATSFTLVGSEWVVSGEWVLSAVPHTVAELAQLFGSPDSQTVTTRWRNWQHDRDLDQRIARSAPPQSYRTGMPLRKININDEEVRQIQAVVLELIPGAI